MQTRSAPKVTAEILRGVGLLRGLSDDTLTVLARELSTVHVEAGETVVEQGGTSAEMFIVVGGEVEVVRKTEWGGEARMALLGPSDWFGEMSILDVQPRSATVRALAPTMLVRITAGDVETLFAARDPKAHAVLIMNMAKELCRRLRVADGILAQTLSSAPKVFGQH